MNLHHSGGEERPSEDESRQQHLITSPREEDCSASLEVHQLSQATAIHQEEMAANHAKDDLSRLIKGHYQVDQSQSNWKLTSGAYIVEQHANQIRAEFKGKLNDANSLFHSIANIKEEVLAILDLTLIERSNLLSFQANAKTIPAAVTQGLRGKKWSDLAPLLHQGLPQDSTTNGSFIRQQLLEVVGYIARYNALKRTVREIIPSLEATSRRIAQGETAAKNEPLLGSARLLINVDSTQAPVTASEEWLIAQNTTAQKWFGVSQHLTATEKAEKIIGYLEELTLASREKSLGADIDQRTCADVLRDRTRAAFITSMARQIELGMPLHFSLYLSLEKFSNPLDTRSSEIDLGELRMVQELEQLVSTVRSITGQAPQITVLNESTATEQFTNGNSTVYREQLRAILELKGLGQNVHFKPFNRDFFIQYLTDQKMPLADAQTLFDQSFSLLRKIYSGLLHNSLSLTTQSDLNSVLSEKYPEYPVAIREKLASYVVKNSAQILSELSQSVRSERAGGLDPSILLPKVPEQMLLKVLDSLQQDTSLTDPGEEGLRKLLTHQAGYQGPFFKALMRMRHFLVYYTQGPTVIPAEVIPLSITAAPDKLSIPLGRARDTGITVLKNGNPTRLPGVLPQHGTGVLTNQGIVSVRWRDIVENKENFHPVRLDVQGTSVSGFIRTMSGMLSDLDGTLIENGEQLSTEACALINDALVAGIPFGIATGRSKESLQRLVREPLIRYLTSIGMDPAAPCYKKLFISGNNGALTKLGLLDPVALDTQGIDITELNKLPAQSGVRAILERCFVKGQATSDLLLGERVPETMHDKYSLYLGESAVRRALEAVGLPTTTTLELADDINREFEREGVALRALANSKSIDIVHPTVDKGRALRLFCERFNIAPQEGAHVLCVGDSPEGNDRHLLDHPGGQSAITAQGVAAVVGYARAMLNLPTSGETENETRYSVAPGLSSGASAFMEHVEGLS